MRSRDQVLPILRAAVADASADSDVRAFAAGELLGFALPEDRDLIASAADGWIFNEESIEDAYAGRTHTPAPRDWMGFYDDGEIARRQERWREEARPREPVSGPDTDGPGRPVPFRAPPRTGRNEPCPCGSGRKFKKCCGP
jgi:hypothetical protein